MSTIEAARDMDVLRSALGHEQLDYLGKSYGTMLGATYAELFPEQVGRFVLDGALDVSLSSRDLSLGQAEGFETALRSYVANCVDTTDTCFLGDSVEQGLTRITDFIAEVDAEPLPTQGERELAGRQRVLRHRRAALQARVLDHPVRRAARGLRG